MSNLYFSVEIKAPKERVWDVMLADETYRQWTAAFHEGSYYQGSWDAGSKILFLAEHEGKLGGMSSRIADNIPYEYISIEHLGEIVDGAEDLESERVQAWKGMRENYRFREGGGVTTLSIELDGAGMGEEVTEMFADMWPKALLKLKEICEA